MDIFSDEKRRQKLNMTYDPLYDPRYVQKAYQWNPLIKLDHMKQYKSFEIIPGVEGGSLKAKNHQNQVIGDQKRWTKAPKPPLNTFKTYVI